MNDNIPGLNIEMMRDGIGDGLILLEQDNSGNIDRVAIHPIHLRYMAEKFGLVATSDPLAQKTIETLTRRLRMLSDRVGFLADYLVEHSDHDYADPSFEMAYAKATAEIAAEFCAELDDQADTDTSEGNAGTMAAPCGHGANTVQASLI